MDRAEYQNRLEEIKSCVRMRDFDRAYTLVEGVDWKRVKSLQTLTMVADIYDRQKDYGGAYKILVLALSRAEIGKSILARLIDNCLRRDSLENAHKYYDQFVKAAPNDPARFLFQYQIAKAENRPLSEQIGYLEEYKKYEYTERWAYELAFLYSKAGDKEKCIEACDDLILWFSEGKYVLKAIELKKQYAELTPTQQDYFDKEQADYDPRLLNTRDETSPLPKVDEKTKKSGDVFDRMEEAGAEVTKDVNLEETGVLHLSDEEIDKFSVTSPVFMGGSPNLKTQLAESIQNVYAGAPEVPKYEGRSLNLEGFDTQALISETAAEFASAATEAEAAEASPEEVKASPERGGVAEGDGRVSLSAIEDDTANTTASAEDAEASPERGGVAEGDGEVASSAIEDDTANTTASAEDAEASPERGGVAEGDGRVSLSAIEDDTANITASAEDIEASPNRGGVGEADGEVKASPVGEVSASADGEVTSSAIEDDTANIMASEATAAAAVGAGAAAAAGATKIFASDAPAEEKPEIIYDEREIPDEPPSPEERITHTLSLEKLGMNTVPIPVEEILLHETPEERRIRIINNTGTTKMNDEQRQIFTYFARVPGMDTQILGSLTDVYKHAGENTSRGGNIAVIGAAGSGKSRLTYGLVVNMCKDMGLDAAKVARISGEDMNKLDPAAVVDKMAGGFLTIEDCSYMDQKTVEKLNKALDFRTDCMILILEDEKKAMRAMFDKYPEFAEKITSTITIPVLTNDELVAFARTYCAENNCEMDELGVLALYTIISSNQTEEEPFTVSQVKKIVDSAISHARRAGRKTRKAPSLKNKQFVILYEKDFLTQ